LSVPAGSWPFQDWIFAELGPQPGKHDHQGKEPGQGRARVGRSGLRRAEPSRGRGTL
jgi:hypothetical protein